MTPARVQRLADLRALRLSAAETARRVAVQRLSAAETAQAEAAAALADWQAARPGREAALFAPWQGRPMGSAARAALAGRLAALAAEEPGLTASCAETARGVAASAEALRAAETRLAQARRRSDAWGTLSARLDRAARRAADRREEANFDAIASDLARGGR